MRFTFEIDDVLIVRATMLCAERGISMTHWIESALTPALDHPLSEATFRLRSFGYHGEGRLLNDWASIRELIYERRGSAP